MIQITGKRDGFGFHSLEYYQKAYELFHQNDACELFQAQYQSQTLAMLMIFIQGKRAWYLFGASNDEHRERMPNYLLQWEAMCWAKQMGCLSYDLWGVPDADFDTLESSFSQRSDGLWGVYRFKRGFGGELLRAAGPWDRIYQPVMYHFYLWWIKRKDKGL
jgi:lipid II:glycine glycyltransferase (peptidoglycan interpeptide bridge formation enzyme)